jgi:hypothetical protein
MTKLMTRVCMVIGGPLGRPSQIHGDRLEQPDANQHPEIGSEAQRAAFRHQQQNGANGNAEDGRIDKKTRV